MKINKQLVKRLITSLCVLIVMQTLFAGCLTLEGCASSDTETCPYVIDNQRMEIGKSNNICEYAGVYFTLFNNAKKTIVKTKISFLLFDSEGKSPFIGSNCITSEYDGAIEQGQSEDVAVGLDNYISTVPDEPYQVDYFYVSEIDYSDGTSWKDPWGMFAQREAVE